MITFENIQVLFCLIQVRDTPSDELENLAKMLINNRSINNLSNNKDDVELKACCSVLLACIINHPNANASILDLIFTSESKIVELLNLSQIIKSPHYNSEFLKNILDQERRINSTILSQIAAHGSTSVEILDKILNAQQHIDDSVLLNIVKNPNATIRIMHIAIRTCTDTVEILKGVVENLNFDLRNLKRFLNHLIDRNDLYDTTLMLAIYNRPDIDEEVLDAILELILINNDQNNSQPLMINIAFIAMTNNYPEIYLNTLEALSAQSKLHLISKLLQFNAYDAVKIKQILDSENFDYTPETASFRDEILKTLSLRNEEIIKQLMRFNRGKLTKVVPCDVSINVMNYLYGIDDTILIPKRENRVQPLYTIFDLYRRTKGKNKLLELPTTKEKSNRMEM